MTDRVDEIMLRMNDMRWPEIEQAVRDYGEEMRLEGYREGFLDGEAAQAQTQGKPPFGTGEDYPEDMEAIGGCVR